MILWKNGLKGVNRMKIEKSKRRKMSEWLQKTGNSPKRKAGTVTQKAREYMRYKPYADVLEGKDG